MAVLADTDLSQLLAEMLIFQDLLHEQVKPAHLVSEGLILNLS